MSSLIKGEYFSSHLSLIALRRPHPLVVERYSYAFALRAFDAIHSIYSHLGFNRMRMTIVLSAFATVTLNISVYVVVNRPLATS